MQHVGNTTGTEQHLCKHANGSRCYKWPYDTRYTVVCMGESPKHKSWLNMAEIELTVLIGPDPGRRIDNIVQVE